MIQQLARPNGLKTYTTLEQPQGLQQPVRETIIKRETSAYWMATLEKNGVSPYAEKAIRFAFPITTKYSAADLAKGVAERSGLRS